MTKLKLVIEATMDVPDGMDEDATYKYIVLKLRTVAKKVAKGSEGGTMFSDDTVGFWTATEIEAPKLASVA